MSRFKHWRGDIMRIEKEVRNGGVTESGLTLIDRDGKSYHWVTKHYGHRLFFLNDDEWVKVKMTIHKTIYDTKIVKNVRIFG